MKAGGMSAGRDRGVAQASACASPRPSTVAAAGRPWQAKGALAFTFLVVWAGALVGGGSAGFAGDEQVVVVDDSSDPEEPTEGTLRYAVEVEAAQTSEPVRIVFDDPAQTVTLQQGELDYRGHVGIAFEGNGWTIRADDEARILRSRDEAANLAVAGLEFVEGDAIATAGGDPPPSAASGGAIRVAGDLTVRESEFVGNQARSQGAGLDAGGGALHTSGDLTVGSSVFRDNSVGAQDSNDPAPYGGAVNAEGGLSVSDSTFHGNSAWHADGFVGSGGAVAASGEVVIAESDFSENFTHTLGAGGAVWAEAPLEIKATTFSGNWSGNGGAVSARGPVVVQTSTFSDNEARDMHGGAIIGGPIRIAQSTFAYNSARVQGGAVSLGASSDHVVVNSTFSDNALDDEDGIGGAALYQGTSSADPDGDLALRHVTVASNTGDSQIWRASGTSQLTVVGTVVAEAVEGTNCAMEGAVESSHSYDTDGSCAFSGRGDTSGGSDPLLGELADNGGPTWTRLPESDSPLIDAIAESDCADAVEDDQRGVARPVGEGCDIGAVERRAEEAEHGGVSGTVTDADDGAAIAEGQVRLERDGVARHTTTGDDGRYAFGDVAAGTYTVSAEADDHTVHTHHGVDVREGETVPVDFALESDPGGIRLTVTVVDEAEEPVSDALVEVDGRLEKRTDAAGDVQWSSAHDDVSEGPVEIRASRDGYDAATVGVDIEPDSVNHVDVTLAPEDTSDGDAGPDQTTREDADSTSLRAVVTDQTSEPIQGAVVELDGELQATTNADGTVHYTELVEGPVEVSITADGYEDVAFATSLREDQLTIVEVTLATSAPGDVQRAAGRDRVDTAARVAESTFDEGANTAVLTTGGGAADALAAAPLGAVVDGPVLLTVGNQLDDRLATALQTLETDEILIVGGSAAVPDAVANDLTRAGYAVDRISGHDRYDTAARVAQEIRQRHGPTSDALVAASDPSDASVGWPDAMGAGSYAAAGQPTPILLTASQFVPDATAEAIDAGDHVEILGGPGVVTDTVAQELERLAATVDRIAGSTRYDTSRQLIDAAVSDGANPDHVWVATGRDFPDGLAAGAAAAHHNGVLALIDGHDPALSSATRDWIINQSPQQLRISGGPSAVSAHAVDVLTQQ